MKKLLSSYKFQAGFTFFRRKKANPLLKFKNNGFTLIELLIVIVIIVIVIGVGAASYTTVARNSRDVQRKSDIEKIQLALEEFFADHGAYPDEGWHSPITNTSYDRVTCGTKGELPGGERGDDGIIAGDPFTCSGRTYLSRMPADPSTGKGYYYETDDTFCEPDPSWANCRQYTLWAELENTNDSDRWVDGQDEICDAAKKSSNPLDSDGWYDGLYEDNYNGNYCVHN